VLPVATGYSADNAKLAPPAFRNTAIGPAPLLASARSISESPSMSSAAIDNVPLPTWTWMGGPKTPVPGFRRIWNELAWKHATATSSVPLPS
jgi:hypothetical protein